jgi:hypothetical protein
MTVAVKSVFSYFKLKLGIIPGSTFATVVLVDLGVGFHILFPETSEQVNFLLRLVVFAPTFLQDLFNNEVAEFAGATEANTNRNEIKPTDNFWFRFIL